MSHERSKMEFWVTLTQDELRSFDGLHYAFPIQVYLALRECMDGKDRVVRISWSDLREKLKSDPVPCSNKYKGGRPSLKTVRYALNVLIERGLINRIGEKRALTLLLLKAPSKRDIDNRQQILSQKGGADEGQTMRGRPSGLVQTDSEHQSGADENRLPGAMRGSLSINQYLLTSSNLVHTNSLPDQRAQGVLFSDLSCEDEKWEELVKIYPRLDNVAKARFLWRKMNLWHCLPEILEDVKTGRWKGDQWTPTLANYLRDRRWEDQTKGETKDFSKESEEGPKKPTIDELPKRVCPDCGVRLLGANYNYGFCNEHYEDRMYRQQVERWEKNQKK
jgi:hypothetical protein